MCCLVRKKLGTLELPRTELFLTARLNKLLPLETD